MARIQLHINLFNITVRPCKASKRCYLGSFSREDQGVVNLR
ncbi:MAG: hypothetical protein ACK4TA_08475 [Saprospiraceae bacterium]